MESVTTSGRRAARAVAEHLRALHATPWSTERDRGRVAARRFNAVCAAVALLWLVTAADPGALAHPATWLIGGLLALNAFTPLLQLSSDLTTSSMVSTLIVFAVLPTSSAAACVLVMWLLGLVTVHGSWRTSVRNASSATFDAWMTLVPMVIVAQAWPDAGVAAPYEVVAVVAAGAAGQAVSWLTYLQTLLRLSGMEGVGTLVRSNLRHHALVSSAEVPLAAFCAYAWTVAPASLLLVLPIALFARRASQQAHAMELLNDRLRTDGLTGVLTRNGLLEACGPLVNRSEEVQIAIIDLDHFKRVNDSLGHQAGDAVLAAAAAELRATLDEASCPALLARWGGEEFCVVLSCGALEARRVLGRAREAVAAACASWGTTASVGVATLTDGDFDDAFRRADDAMYRAKAGGRNRLEADGHDGRPTRRAA